jgi:SNF2 family DNA or RNA helicase
MIRRMKSQVLKNLPGKDRIVEYVLPDPVFVPEIKRMQSRMSAIDRAMKDSSGDSDAIKGEVLDAYLTLLPTTVTVYVNHIVRKIFSVSDTLYVGHTAHLTHYMCEDVCV